MKKILHISNYYPPNPGGIEQVAYDIVRCLRVKYEQKVICFNEGKETLREKYEGIEILRVGYYKKVASQAISFSYFNYLKTLIKDFKPDIIHIHLPNPLITLYLLMIKNRKKSKLIIHWHSDIIKQRNFMLFYRPIQNKILEEADLILTTSQKYLEGSEDLKNFKNKTSVLTNSVNFSKLTLNDENMKKIQEIKDKYERPIAFFLGRHIGYKGIGYLIKASKKINIDIKILIAGDGPLTNELKKQASGDPNIEFLGRLSDEELKVYMHAADVFTFPSITKNEAFGIALAEALYCGTPAVCFNIEGSGVSWVNQDKYTGLVVENKNEEKFGEAITNILRNSDLKKKFSDNARIWANQEFSLEKMKLNILKIYTKLLD